MYYDAYSNIMMIIFEDNGNITAQYEYFESTTHTQTIGTWDSSAISITGDFVLNETSLDASSIQPSEQDGRITVIEFGHGTY